MLALQILICACFASLLVSAFDCDLAPRPEVNIPPDQVPVVEKVSGYDIFMMSMELMYGGLPGGSIGLMLADKFLGAQEQKKGPWDQVKDKVEQYVHKEIDANNVAKLCKDLKEFRRRIDNCRHDTGMARTSCLKNLLDYMIGKEPHFKGTTGSDIALMIGPYTMYTVMTLSLGNMFIKQNNEFKMEGAATLAKLKPAAKRFSQYINESIPEAVKWRMYEIGHYEKKKKGFWGNWVSDGTGNVLVNKKRAVEEDEDEDDIPAVIHPGHKYIQPKNLTTVKTSKRYGGHPSSSKYYVKLIVKDRLTGKEVFNKEDFGKLNSEEGFAKLFKQADPFVTDLRNKAKREMEAIYDEQIRKISNQYWRIYDEDDFGSVEAEAKNREWLNVEEKAAARDNVRRAVKGIL